MYSMVSGQYPATEWEKVVRIYTKPVMTTSAHLCVCVCVRVYQHTVVPRNSGFG